MTASDNIESATPLMANRFRGFLPVVIDVETGGFNSATDALLEIAAVTVDFDADAQLDIRESMAYHVAPFEGANIEPASLEVNGIDPHHPLRPALPEHEALARIFKVVRQTMKEAGCKRAVLVGHNAHFDLGFLNAAIARTGIKRSPFHPFSCFDTATLAGVALGQTVLKRAATAAGMSWDSEAAHSARYDTEQTARLFCTIVNRFQPIYENIPPLPQN
ncbi:ribonuclease T [Salinisphaera orenii MK-B5]|uniref:Ribonuclease T n=2 Tax=Salinisphaera orenii TaxID=856731 RepID=A0A423PQ55_9GAMM|nr:MULTISPECIES: ribonuclease T [Salinisphaera]ROO27739.1 ribonuclease T [Salinisphaera orenii MK-B5]ROO36766.1 ribonuclease T [Salinisphaera halophila YIM 95161]